MKDKTLQDKFPKIYQREFYSAENKRMEWETVYLYSTGRVRCDTCVHQIWNKKRDYESNCKHALQLLEDIKNGNLLKWKDVTPK